MNIESIKFPGTVDRMFVVGCTEVKISVENEDTDCVCWVHLGQLNERSIHDVITGRINEEILFRVQILIFTKRLNYFLKRFWFRAILYFNSFFLQ